MFIKYFDIRLRGILKRSLIILNKKSGITSHDEVYNLRRIIQKEKVGHSGTLDPKVTGVLVCGIGKGTKVLEYILLSEKKYEAIFEFHSEISRTIFEENIEKFLGKIIQMPPQKSSVKREEREREVYSLKILEYDENNRWAKVLCSVERGTYIRKLAHDIGQKIGVNISMGPLHRVRAGVFSENNSNIISSNDLRILMNKFNNEQNLFYKFYLYLKLAKYIYPIEELFQREDKIKKIYIKKEAYKYVLAGNPVRVKNISKIKNINKGDIVSIWYKKKVLAIGEVLEELSLNSYKVEEEVIKLKKVF